MNHTIKILLFSTTLLNNTTLLQAMDANAAAINNAVECPICDNAVPQEARISSETVFTCDQGHGVIYCDSCMAGWIQTRRQAATCPYCRAPLHAQIGEVTPLVRAVLEEIHAAQAVALIPVPAAVDEPENDQLNTALLAATFRRQLSTVQRLLTQPGINVNTHGVTTGETPLITAAYADYLAIMQTLLAHPTIDVNARDNAGKTALMWAAEWSTLATVQMLLAHRNTHNQPDADVNAVDNANRTTLSYATDEIRHLLIAHGAHE